MIITGGWVFLFAAAAVLVVYAPLSVNIAYGILMFVLGALSGRFGHWYSSRRLKAMGLLDLDQPPPDDQAGAA